MLIRETSKAITFLNLRVKGRSQSLLSCQRKWVSEELSTVPSDQGSRYGLLVRVLSLPTNVAHIWFPDSALCGLHLLLVLVLAPRGFSLGSPGFPFPRDQKANISKSQFNLESEDHRFVSHNRLLSVTLVKQLKVESLIYWCMKPAHSILVWYPLFSCQKCHPKLYVLCNK